MNEIVIYGKPNCPNCDTLKTELEINAIPYNYIDVTEDSESYAMLISENFRSVPQIFVGGMAYGSLSQLPKLVENYRK